MGKGAHGFLPVIIKWSDRSAMSGVGRCRAREGGRRDGRCGEKCCERNLHDEFPRCHRSGNSSGVAAYVGIAIVIAAAVTSALRCLGHEQAEHRARDKDDERVHYQFQPVWHDVPPVKAGHRQRDGPEWHTNDRGGAPPKPVSGGGGCSSTRPP